MKTFIAIGNSRALGKTHVALGPVPDWPACSAGPVGAARTTAAEILVTTSANRGRPQGAIRHWLLNFAASILARLQKTSLSSRRCWASFRLSGRFQRGQNTGELLPSEVAGISHATTITGLHPMVDST